MNERPRLYVKQHAILTQDDGVWTARYGGENWFVTADSEEHALRRLRERLEHLLDDADRDEHIITLGEQVAAGSRSEEGFEARFISRGSYENQISDAMGNLQKSDTVGGDVYRWPVIERVRIVAETSATDYAARFGRVGRTMGGYLAELMGPEGYINDPFGTRQWISLRALDGTDPDLFLKIMFVVPEVPGGDFAPLQGDAVLLKEYELPEGTIIPR